MRQIRIAALTLIAGHAAPLLAKDPDRCAALAGRSLPAQTIALPTQGAVIVSARMEGEGDERYCQVKGKIAPVDPSAPPVLFAVNLPERWNGKAAQIGGGGLNGTLVTGTGPTAHAPPGVTPLGRGFATFGTDGGHDTKPNPAAFALNREALINHAHGAYKKSRDVAVAIIGTYYSRKPSRTYFLGSSEGGREALIVAQRYPNDYDGVVSVVPLVSFVGMQVAKMATYQKFGKHGFTKAQVGLVRDATMSQCDRKDGATDGVVSAYLECRVNLAPLRCKPSQAAESCLSDDQIRWFEAVHAPYRFDYAHANGLRAYPPFGYGGEFEAQNALDVVLSGQPPIMPLSIVRYFMLNGTGDALAFDPIKHEDRIKELSAMLDATDPDLSAFAARGGKLIISAAGADYTVSPYHAMTYYESVARTLGKKRADEFLRLYVAPGIGHYREGTQADGSPVPDKTDFLAALDGWVEQGTAPGDLVMTSYAKDGAAIEARPLCRYPAYPKLMPPRDRKKPESYKCTRQSTASLKRAN